MVMIFERLPGQGNKFDRMMNLLSDEQCHLLGSKESDIALILQKHHCLSHL